MLWPLDKETELDIFKTDWIPDKNLGVEENQDAVKKIQFGGGVVQQQKRTLGPVPNIYSLTFSRRPEFINEINNFLIQQSGKRFLWNPPFENRQIVVMYSDKSLTRTGFVDTLSVKFTELDF